MSPERWAAGDTGSLELPDPVMQRAPKIMFGGSALFASYGLLEYSFSHDVINRLSITRGAFSLVLVAIALICTGMRRSPPDRRIDGIFLATFVSTMAIGISVLASISIADPSQGFTFCLLVTLLPLFYWSPPWMLAWHVLGTTIPPSLMIVLSTETQRTKVSSLLAAMVAAMLAVASYAVFQKAKRQIEILNLDLMRSATRDHVTGLLSRASWYILAAKAVKDAAISKRSLVLLYVDLDQFKQVNDTHGHTIGDRVLLLTADCLKRTLPDRSILARMGGEEFVALLPDRDLAGAGDIAERFHTEFRGMNELPLTLTASIGIAGFRPGETLEGFIDRADRAMFRAKGSGRNSTAFDRVETAVGGDGESTRVSHSPMTGREPGELHLIATA